jgi:hypothetical protein
LKASIKRAKRKPGRTEIVSLSALLVFGSWFMKGAWRVDLRDSVQNLKLEKLAEH